MLGFLAVLASFLAAALVPVRDPLRKWCVREVVDPIARRLAPPPPLPPEPEMISWYSRGLD
jgi:hypothetical protein